MFSFLKKSVFAAFVACFACVPAFAQSRDVVVSDPILINVRQGICPIKVQATDSALGGLVQKALDLHGAVEMRTGGNVPAVKVERRGGTLVASCKIFPQEIVVAGTDNEAALRLCDEILAALGKPWGWDLKPIFSKTKLAFAAGNGAKSEIYTTENLLFKGTRKVTSHGSRSIMPHWNPAGTKLLYTTYFKSGAADIYMLDLATLKSKPFAAYKNSNTGGAFSPDGKTVALALSVRGPMNIFLSPASGGKAHALVKDGDTSSSPSFSPDGKTVVFTSGTAGAPRLYTVPVSGGKKSRISIPGFGYATEPSWNPVFPNKIAFCYNRSGKMAVAVYDRKTGRAFDVGALTGTRRYSHPVWCADGRHIVVTEEIGKSTGLALVDTGNPQKAKFRRIGIDSLKNCCDPDTLILK